MVVSKDTCRRLVLVLGLVGVQTMATMASTSLQAKNAEAKKNMTIHKIIFSDTCGSCQCSDGCSSTFTGCHCN